MNLYKYLFHIFQLEATIKKLTGDLKESHEKLTHHDAAAKKAIAALKNELQVRVAEVNWL